MYNDMDFQVRMLPREMILLKLSFVDIQTLSLSIPPCIYPIKLILRYYISYCRVFTIFIISYVMSVCHIITYGWWIIMYEDYFADRIAF